MGRKEGRTEDLRNSRREGSLRGSEQWAETSKGEKGEGRVEERGEGVEIIGRENEG